MNFNVNSQLKRYILAIPEVKTQGLAGFVTQQKSIKPNVINTKIYDKINDKIAVFIPKIDYLALELAIKQLNEDYGFFKDNVKFYTYTNISLDSITRLYTEFKHDVIFVYKTEITIDEFIILDDFCLKNSITCFFSSIPIITNTIINLSTSNSEIKMSYTSLLNNINDLLPPSPNPLQPIENGYTNAMIILEENSVNSLLENELLRQTYPIKIDLIIRVKSSTDTFTDEIVNYLSNTDTNYTHMCIINITDPSYLFRNINSIVKKNPNLNKRLFAVNATFVRTKPTFNINSILSLFTNVGNYEKYTSFLNFHNEVSVNKLLKIGSIVQDIEPLIVKMNNKKMGKNLLSELKKMEYVVKDNDWYNDIVLFLRYSLSIDNNITYEDNGILFSFQTSK